MKLKCNANQIEMGRTKIRFKDIERIFYSESNGKTSVHVFNAGTGKHIGEAFFSSEEGKDFISGLSGFCNRYKIPFDREDEDRYKDSPVEKYEPVPLDTFERRKKMVQRAGRVLLFVLCSALALLIAQTKYMTVIAAFGAGIVLMFVLMKLTSQKVLKGILGIAGLAGGVYGYSQFITMATSTDFPPMAMFFAVFLPPALALFLIIRAFMD